MEVKSFEYLNRVCEEKLKDISLFSVSNYNFFKIVQHGITYSENSDDSRVLNTKIDKWYFLFIWLIKSIIFHKSYKNYNLKEIVVYEMGRERFDLNGGAVSMYFHNIINALSKENITIIQKNSTNILKEYDLNLNKIKIRNGFFYFPNIKMFFSVRKVLKRIKKNIKFSDRDYLYIKTFFHLFFEEYVYFNMLFKNKKVKTCFFVTHYQQEGFIAALRENNVKVIELQHGLISKNDLYYVYPQLVSSVAKYSFFPDILLVNGMYWKNLLSAGFEHDPENVKIIGDCTFKNHNINSYLSQDLQKENIILICTQVTWHDYYPIYIEKLSVLCKEKHPGWKLIVKLHPSEYHPEAYQYLNSFSNIEIVGNESDLYLLFKKAKIQISIYSTTFYEAFGFDIVNYSIQDYTSCKDYAKEAVENKIAHPILFDSDPVEIYNKEFYNYKFENREYYYSKFDEVLLKNLIENN